MELLKTHKQTISSREIADLTGKRHDNVLRDIRNLLENTGQSTFALSSYVFELKEYTNSQNKIQPMYLLNKKAGLLLASGYDVLLRVKMIDRLDLNLENELMFNNLYEGVDNKKNNTKHIYFLIQKINIIKLVKV